MTFAKFEGNRLRIDGEIAENHAVLVNLTASKVDPCIERVLTNYDFFIYFDVSGGRHLHLEVNECRKKIIK